VIPSDERAAEVLAGHVQELRRGTVVLACLAALRRRRYGYRLLDDLATAGISVEGNTLYPLLRRLEGHGLLSSEWDTGAARPRKFYETTDVGRAVLAALVEEWRALDAAVGTVLADHEGDEDR
jgi:DNA-binding PadR family transcriptional regulator